MSTGVHDRRAGWRGWWAAWVVVLVLGMAPRTTWAAEGPTAVLELEEVLASVRRTHPTLEGAQRVVDEVDDQIHLAR